MKVALAARLLFEEWKSRPEYEQKWWNENTYYWVVQPRDEYLSFLKTQAQDSTAHGHAAYKLAVKWIEAD